MSTPAFPKVNDEVRIERTTYVRVLRRTSDGPRGWAEGAVSHIKVTKDADNEHLLFEIEGDVYRLSPKVIEAIYDVHQGVPRDE